MNITNYIICFVIAYLYASIPFSLLVGFMYKKDIRNEGSGNIGGSNLGRTCGKKAFALGFLLDLSKGSLAVLLGYLFGVDPVPIAAFALLGHSFSIFIKFKGGKGIATAFGFVLAYTPLGAIIAITGFLIFLYIWKYVSLASMLCISIYVVYTIFVPSLPIYYTGLIFVLWGFIVFKHRTNITRIKNKTETKITWM